MEWRLITLIESRKLRLLLRDWVRLIAKWQLCDVFMLDEFEQVLILLLISVGHLHEFLVPLRGFVVHNNRLRLPIDYQARLLPLAQLSIWINLRAQLVRCKLGIVCLIFEVHLICICVLPIYVTLSLLKLRLFKAIEAGVDEHEVLHLGCHRRARSRLISSLLRCNPIPNHEMNATGICRDLSITFRLRSHFCCISLCFTLH